ncbi:MAG: hypothetical protein WB699_09220 [Bacteroidota bacterium]
MNGYDTVAGKTPSSMRSVNCANLKRSLLFTILLNATALAQSGESFPGFTWGTPFRQIQEVRTLSAPDIDEREERYVIPLNRLGKSEIEECEFEFTDGLFSGIVIMTRGHENTAALLTYLEERFGKGDLTYTRFWQWLNEETYVSLDEDSSGDGYVLWYGVRWQGDGEKDQ